VQAVVKAKANKETKGKGRYLTPCGSETPEPISIKLRMYLNHGPTSVRHKTRRRCDNVGSIGEHLTRHMFLFLNGNFLLYYWHHALSLPQAMDRF